MSRARVGWSLLLIAVIYLASIPALFDLSLGHAAVLSDADYDKANRYFTTPYDIAVHDGPGLNQSLATVGHRTALLESTMKTAMESRQMGLVPGWSSPHRDYYLAIQRQSFAHVLYPFF